MAADTQAVYSICRAVDPPSDRQMEGSTVDTCKDMHHVTTVTTRKGNKFSLEFLLLF